MQCRYLRRDSPTANWYSIQPILERSTSDVLILDCCYAASAARSGAENTVELLAACGGENRTTAVADNSFTSVLMEEMAASGSQPFTLAQLHGRLIKERPKLRSTPIHAFLCNGRDPSIQLAPVNLPSPSPRSLNGLAVSQAPPILESDDNSDAFSASIYSSKRASEESVQTASPDSLSFEQPRVLLAVSLLGTEQPPDIQSWTNWLKSNAPLEVCGINVRIESAFISHSSLLLFSLPITL